MGLCQDSLTFPFFERYIKKKIFKRKKQMLLDERVIASNILSEQKK